MATKRAHRNGRSVDRLRGRTLSSLAILAALAVVAGCDKVPTWTELTQGKKTEEQPSAAKAAPQPAAKTAAAPAPQKPPEAPKLTPQEVIAKFNSTPPQQRTDALLTELGSLKEGLDQFTEMNFSNSAVTDAGLAVLPKFERLEVLTLDACQISSHGLQNLAKMKNLNTVSVMYGTVKEPNSDNAVAVLGRMPQITSLRLDRAKLSEEGFRRLGAMTSLESLSIANVPMGNSNMQFIANLTNLKELNISSTLLTDDGLAGLLPLKALESLYMADLPQMTGRGLKELVVGQKALLKLKVLGISNNPKINSQAYEAIFRMKKLETLDVNEANLDDALFVHAIAPLSNLQKLTIGRDRCTDQGMVALPKLRKLKVFVVDRDPAIDDGALPAIAKLKQLEKLILTDSLCSENRLRALRKTNPKLEITVNQKKIE